MSCVPRSIMHDLVSRPVWPARTRRRGAARALRVARNTTAARKTRGGARAPCIVPASTYLASAIGGSSTPNGLASLVTAQARFFHRRFSFGALDAPLPAALLLQ